MALFDIGAVLKPLRNSLKSKRALQLFDAIQDSDDFDLLELRSVAAAEKQSGEVLVVDCTSHGVPNKNKIGISCCEPLAIIIWQDPRRLPEVLALREGFPVTLHQNHVPAGSPPSLCLYNERATAVYRIWTAQAFLARIQWWLERASRGQLHAEDQAPEQLFFESPLELVLPHDFGEKVGNQQYRLVVERAIEHPDNRLTMVAEMRDHNDGRPSSASNAYPVAIELAPMMNGPVEQEPNTLGELEDRLVARGSTALTPLLESIRRYVGDGKDEDATIKYTLLVVRIFLALGPGQPITRRQVRAFYVESSPLSIGKAAGVLIHHQKRYFIDHLGKKTPNDVVEWRKIALTPVEIQESLLPEKALQYSGLAGPDEQRGILIGVGALGSTMLQLWSRSGWANWTLVENDHLKPHNFVRHAATPECIGANKGIAMAMQDAALYSPGHYRYKVIQTAAASDSAAFMASLPDATLVVDASTTVDLPRMLGCVDGIARAMSVFLTPNGRDAVLLAEDANRQYRLDCLEPQYYRAMLTEHWGEGHIVEAGAKLRSGAGCRDLSLVMSYTTVAAHAATLADQVRVQNMGEGPCIRVWVRNNMKGDVASHDVAVSMPICQKIDGVTIVWDEGLRTKLDELRQQSLPNETGGVLLGYHDFNVDKIYVVDIVPAPPDSVGSPASFKRGIQGLASAVDDANRLTGRTIRYVGEWHSHPRGCASLPSGDDLWQALYLGQVLFQDGLPALMLIVGEGEQTWLMARAG